jgi:hypothetical protein
VFTLSPFLNYVDTCRLCTVSKRFNLTYKSNIYSKHVSFIILRASRTGIRNLKLYEQIHDIVMQDLNCDLKHNPNRNDNFKLLITHCQSHKMIIRFTIIDVEDCFWNLITNLMKSEFIFLRSDFLWICICAILAEGLPHSLTHFFRLWHTATIHKASNVGQLHLNEILQILVLVVQEKLHFFNFSQDSSLLINLVQKNQIDFVASQKLAS